MPSPKSLDDLRAGIDKLLDAGHDPIVARALNPLIEQLMGEYQKLRQPPKPSREEVAAGLGPLDKTPEGDVGGIPLQQLLPRLSGIGAR